MSLRQRNNNFRGIELASKTRLSTNKNNEFEAGPIPISRLQNSSIKPLIALISIAFIVLGFGTIYSNVTSNDACQILEELLSRDDVVSKSKDLPRLFHYQSKARGNITNETNTWMKLLRMPRTSQEYPNIIKPNSSSTSWTGVYWSDKSCRKLVEDQFPEFVESYQSFPHNIQRVDSCRYLILSTYGGVYADTDVSVHATNLNEFVHLIPEGVGLVESPYRYNEVWQNSLMTASFPGHVFWNITIEVMSERAHSHNVLSSTGPKMIGDAVEQFRQHYGHGSNDDIKVTDVHTLPCELFHRLPLGEWDTTFLNIIGREVLARAALMQGCGRYGNGRCEITRHVGRASWTNDAGIT